jgi:hypothetical protein
MRAGGASSASVEAAEVFGKDIGTDLDAQATTESPASIVAPSATPARALLLQRVGELFFRFML